jgi:hypothetical protein
MDSLFRLLAPLAVPPALAACAAAPKPPVALPASLAVSADEAWAGTLAAKGVQVYECRAGAAGPAWAFVAPEATLAEPAGQPAGTHGAGPYWQAPDGSRVEGKVLARADAPAAGTIPWLLLETRSTGRAGRFEPVHRIRRVHTTGGAAPAAGCDAASLGRQARVPYTADYLLYVPR